MTDGGRQQAMMAIEYAMTMVALAMARSVLVGSQSTLPATLSPPPPLQVSVPAAPEAPKKEAKCRCGGKLYTLPRFEGNEAGGVKRRPDLPSVTGVCRNPKCERYQQTQSLPEPVPYEPDVDENRRLCEGCAVPLTPVPRFLQKTIGGKEVEVPMRSIDGHCLTKDCSKSVTPEDVDTCNAEGRCLKDQALWDPGL